MNRIFQLVLIALSFNMIFITGCGEDKPTNTKVLPTTISGDYVVEGTDRTIHLPEGWTSFDGIVPNQMQFLYLEAGKEGLDQRRISMVMEKSGPVSVDDYSQVANTNLLGLQSQYPGSTLEEVEAFTEEFDMMSHYFEFDHETNEFASYVAHMRTETGVYAMQITSLRSQKEDTKTLIQAIFK